MRSQAFPPIAAMLSVMLLTGQVNAGPVAISEVIQVIGSYQNPPELRLRSLTQTASTTVSGVKGSTVTSRVEQSGADGQGTGSAGNAPDSLLAGVAVVSNDPPAGVEILEGEFEGTICDCGELTIPGGFPKWPLLFLGAIPLFFIDGGDDGDDIEPKSTPTPPPGVVDPRSIPTPTPTPIPVPEPASLLLFGSGLAAIGAGLRRRYAKAKLVQVDATEEA